MKISNFYIIFFLSLILLMQAVLWGPFLNEPLERDEGAYAYIAQRMLAGEVAYRDNYDNKPPAVYFIYAGILKTFGESIFSIRIFTLFVSLITTLFIFAIGSFLWSSTGGLLSAMFYALFSSGPYIQGTSANTETFMVLFLVLAFYCFLYAKEWKWFFLAGLFSGLAVMTKQVALMNFLALLFFVLYTPDRIRNGARMMLGFFVFPLLFSCYFFFKGALPDYLDGLIFRNLLFIGGRPWEWGRCLSIILHSNLLAWVLSSFAVVYIFCKDRQLKNLLMAGWGLCSVVGVMLGHSFFGHYFIQVVPGLAFLSVYSLHKLSRDLRESAMVVITLLALTFSSLVGRIDLLYKSPEEISIKKYGTINFVLAKDVADFLKQNSSGDDMVYIWGAEPEMYFYSKTKSASKYIHYYPLLFGEEKAQPARFQAMSEISRNRPKYIILTNPNMVYENLNKYLKSNYNLLKSYYHWQIWEVNP